MTDNTIAPPTAHATLSPSARHRWSRCPGSVRECKKYPDERSSPAAIDGTHSHSLLEVCIEKGIRADVLIGKTISDDDGDFKVDAERAERVQFALDYVTRRKDELGVSVVHPEGKVNPESLVGRKDMSGTVDVQIVTDDVFEIIDYKDGMNPVNAVDNHQLEQYGFGALAPYIANDKVPFNTITMTIIQPKLRMKGMVGISSQSVPIAEFMAKLPTLIAEAAATDNPNAPLVPGDEQCKYCRAKGSCTAMANQAMKQAGITFDNLDFAKQSADKEPTEMTDQQIREILEAAPLLRQMIEGVEKEALRRFEAGKTIDGLKAVRGRGSRQWSFDDEVMAEKLKKMGIPKSSLWKTSLLSPAQAEKVVWTKRNGDTVQLTERQLKTMSTEYVKMTQGKLTVVSSSDDRPAVQLSAASMFEAISETVAPVFPALPSWLS